MDLSTEMQKFHWEPQPAAQAVVDALVAEFFSLCLRARSLAGRMKQETGTRFHDWIDFIEVPDSPSMGGRLREVGFERRSLAGAPGAHTNELGIFPTVILSDRTRVGLKVDSVADFLAANHVSDGAIEGEPGSAFRMAPVYRDARAELWVVERHGWRGFVAPEFDAGVCLLAQKHSEAFRTRRRDFADDTAGYAHTRALVDRAVADIGRDRACDLFFQAEREYWMRRNRAAQVQYGRQNRLGMGWANHDHHTYRCARATFTQHVALLEALGFHCRERFYAGAEAGWGAQVMEQPVTGITTFNDVDMSPEELLGNFSHDGFREREGALGTVGLWCALHGQALLQAGMHHLECQFDWHALVEQLDREADIKTMDPFTTFPYLRQAFTDGERWSVDPARVDALLARGLITQEQGETFKKYGAIGSHLENLERADGFKGFNQQGVSDIIARTDPRRLVGVGD